MSNAKAPARWPYKAAAAADEVQALLSTIRELARKSQMAAIDGNPSLVVVLQGDIREKATTASDVLARARRGEYEE